MFSSDRDNETKAIARYMATTVDQHGKELARLEERFNYLINNVSELERKITEVQSQIDGLRMEVRDTSRFVSEYQQRSDKLSEHGYALIFGWLQTFIPWVCIGVLTWLLTHRQPSPTPPQNTKDPAVEQDLSGASKIYP
jgi:TolA-binding protein